MLILVPGFRVPPTVGSAGILALSSPFSPPLIFGASSDEPDILPVCEFS